MRVARSISAAFVVISAVIAGCGEDFGTCEETAGRTLVYSPSDGTPYYVGQAMVQYGCAEGVCHSASATGDARKGAPHGLDFDIRPLVAASTASDATLLSAGITKVRDEGGSVYGAVKAGTMPPGEAGTRVAPKWNIVLADKTVSTIELPSITSDVGKSTVRNWLACGAPVVAGVTAAAAAATPIGDVVASMDSTPTGNDFSTVYTRVLAPCAAACHTPGGSYPLLDLSSETIARASISKAGPATCAAAGPLVVAGSCATSPLYLKLGPTPTCGARMPQGQPPVTDANMALLCAWIDAGAK